MTREEIGTLARDLNYNVRFGGGDINGDALQIENVLVALVRATLEEAAQEVCDECCNVRGPFMHRGECRAQKIHDLIAAMGKEAKGE